MTISIGRRSALQLAGGGVMLLGVPAIAVGQEQDFEAPAHSALLAPLLRYLWGLDTLDPLEMRAAFAPGALIQDAEGKVWGEGEGGLEAFLLNQVRGPRGAQHYLQLNRTTAAPGHCLAESYWSRVEWRASEPMPVLTALGSFTDELTVRDGAWLIRSRQIGLWNSETVQVPVVAEASE